MSPNQSPSAANTRRYVHREALRTIDHSASISARECATAALIFRASRVERVDGREDGKWVFYARWGRLTCYPGDAYGCRAQARGDARTSEDDVSILNYGLVRWLRDQGFPLNPYTGAACLAAWDAEPSARIDDKCSAVTAALKR